MDDGKPILTDDWKQLLAKYPTLSEEIDPKLYKTYFPKATGFMTSGITNLFAADCPVVTKSNEVVEINIPLDESVFNHTAVIEVTVNEMPSQTYKFIKYYKPHLGVNKILVPTIYFYGNTELNFGIFLTDDKDHEFPMFQRYVCSNSI